MRTHQHRALGAAVLTLVAAFLALTPAPAWAHATLVDSSPDQGDRLDALPSQVRFEFNEDMSSPAYVIVTDPDGASVTSGEPRVEGPVVSQDITGGPDGTYTMAYRAVSEDGHPVTGEITFVVGAAGSTSATPGADPSSAGTAPAEPTSQASPDAATDATSWSRQSIAITVGLGLFVLAGLLLLLSRRRAP